MANQSDDDFIDDWVDAINQRGIFARPTQEARRIVDRSTAAEFAAALKSLHGIEITSICDGPDPPDVRAQVGTRWIGLEMVQLLKRKVLEKRLRASPAFAYQGQFEESQWTREEFERRVNELLDAKENKYTARQEDWVADALIVHTDEDWLDWHAIQGWLSGLNFRPRRKLRSAYLLLTYSPLYPKPHWPLFRLYGNFD